MSLRSILKGWMGEAQTRLGQGLFLDREMYVSINNITLNAANGTTQIDHVIVSRFGVFVVETKKMSGWIFGNELDAQWTQSLFGKKFRFQNPLRQNYRHIKVLSELLDIPEEKFHSVVVFWGGAKLKTAVPAHVMTKGYTGYIKGKSKPIIEESEISTIVNILKRAGLPKTWNTRRNHIAGLKARFESTTTCPKCSSRLVLRTSKTGSRAGSQFYGCSKYPTCRYVRDARSDA